MSKGNGALHVAVCIPSNGVWRAATAKAVALLFAHASGKRYGTSTSQKISIIAAESSMLCQNREAMTKTAMQSGCSHILFIDSDMIFPANTLERLLDANKPFVAANCTTRAEPVETVAHTLDGKRLQSWGKSGLVKVQHVGLAVALIAREVLEPLRQPLFLMDWIPPLQAYCGEDVYFCQKVRQAGFDLWVDHDLSKEIFHIGDRYFGHKDAQDGNA